MKPLVEIMQLNLDRYGTDFDYTKAMEKLSEELDEFTEANAKGDMHELVDSLADLLTIAVGELTKLGFNPELVLKQTVKEISSRQQDPDQTKRWASGDRAAGEKWVKDPNQSKSTLYVADYSTCKL